ncbi:MAG: ABC transporter ATP-binding protein [Deltaproteobacteria bacterium]|nr:ABC transporter ATP-binding protein [Deltaproteobacteria bacterium]
MISTVNLSKSYREGNRTVAVLKGLDFSLRSGKKIGIAGASGVGKSTLLHILGGLDQPTEGRVEVEGENFYQLGETKRAALRNRFFGFVFQFYHLLPELSALENVMLPALIAGNSKSEAAKKASVILEKVGLKDRTKHLPSQLSGGEQQRVAVARACILKPKVILADEPTGNLDEKTGAEVLGYLHTVVKDAGGSLVLVTHNRDLLKTMDENYELKDGTLWKS